MFRGYHPGPCPLIVLGWLRNVARFLIIHAASAATSAAVHQAGGAGRAAAGIDAPNGRQASKASHDAAGGIARAGGQPACEMRVQRSSSSWPSPTPAGQERRHMPRVIAGPSIAQEDGVGVGMAVAGPWGTDACSQHLQQHAFAAVTC